MNSDDETYIPSEFGDQYEEEDDTSESSNDSLLHGYSSAEEDRVLREDFNHLFETDQTFLTRDAAVTWLHGKGDAHNMYFVISTTRTNLRSYIKCHRGNKHRLTPTKKGAKSRESSGSARIGCPFQLSVELNKMTLQWHVRTMGEQYGRHNHRLGDNKEGYRRPSAIKPHEYEMIRVDTALGISPVICLGRLKTQEEPNYSTRQHVYNARQKLRREKMGGVLALGMLINLLLQNGWFENHEFIEGSRQIGNIFFADTRSLQLLEQFCEVLIVDATYKTNIWKLPLVEIMGFVPTGQNYHVAFAFICDETEIRYTWVMRQVNELLMDLRNPRIFITDRELALMNAIRRVFPGTVNLLCRRHIATDVHKYLTKLVKSKDRQEDLSDCWNSIVYAETMAEYESAVLNFKEEFEKYPKFTYYVKKTSLTKYHDKFVAFWVDQHMHFGAITTSRVESAHAQLKNELHSTQDNLNIVWEAINRVVTRQLDTNKGAFEQARCKINSYAVSRTVFIRVAGKVAPHAIMLMVGQLHARKSERYNGLCDCTLWTSHGLPCKCRILQTHKNKVPIDPVDINLFWRSLHMDGSIRPPIDERRATTEQLLDESVQMYKDRHGELDMKILVARRHQESYPEFEEYENPPTPPRKGRPPKA